MAFPGIWKKMIFFLYTKQSDQTIEFTANHLEKDEPNMQTMYGKSYGSACKLTNGFQKLSSFIKFFRINIII